MVLKAMPVGQSGQRMRRGVLLACVGFALQLAVQGRNGALCQMRPPDRAAGIPAAMLNAPAGEKTTELRGASEQGRDSGNPGPQPQSREHQDQIDRFEGLPVRRISFEGVGPALLAPLPGHLAQTEGAPLNRENLKASLRQLFATGLYDNVDVEASPQGDGLELVFHGVPRAFIGTVSVDGAKGATLNTQLQRAGQLTPGTRYTAARLNQAIALMTRTLADNGYNQPTIAHTLTPHPQEQLVDVAFRVVSGPQARVGAVQVVGDSGMTVPDFRRHAHLRAGSRVDHDTDSKALDGVLKHYQKEDRLEAEIKLEAKQYVPATSRDDFRFSSNRGPTVKVLVEGVKMDSDRIKRLIPIYEEGTVDDDLLNEGNRRLRDFYQRLGYFDVKVEHERQTTGADQVVILYKVRLGPRRRVERVSVTGNHYFDSATLKELLSVHAADTLDRHGAYSQALVSADIGALQAVYQNNGFSKVKVTSETDAAATQGTGTPVIAGRNAAAPLTLVYRIEEGSQLRVGTVRLEGNAHADTQKLTTLLNSAPGQLLSPQNLAGDRDAIFSDYLSRGFRQVQVEVTQQIEPADPSKVDVVFHIAEGQQVFVRNVLIAGLRSTRPDTVARAVTLHPGDPLNQSALMDTQRNLYELALFNEVNTAVENPNGGDEQKTVLLQLTEARRWALTYGGGFEAQTGTPHYNCGLIILSGAPCNTAGKTGVSPRVLGAITRNNLFGRELSASLQGTYGLLEQKVDLLFEDPHFQNNRNFRLDFSAGYANSLDVTTYVASKLEGSVRATEHFDTPGGFLNRANTFVYQLNFRRVKVQANSLQVAPGEITEESTATRVAGPALTWIRDTRDSPLDPHRGTYTSIQEFLSDRFFGAQAQFNRLDVSNSSYFSFDKGRFVLARNTRYGQERAFGTPEEELIPLPERLFAGGPTALRGFSVNAAGPRDPETGYPIGGAGALANSTELRLPPTTLPWLGDTVSFVLFHDMGNIFTNASDAWASVIRTRQPDRDSCKNPEAVLAIPTTQSPGPVTSTGWQGPCNFNYFSHAPGVGLRYHTPIGPLRFDFSYNLNTPIYPVAYNYSLSQAASDPHVGEAGHFNFFFSLGQTF
ncbi:MAG: POTRA domain-containing protein [Terracidiphilus sp.]|jgi:outer membrane protein assembly complex protein YaeT